MNAIINFFKKLNNTASASSIIPSDIIHSSEVFEFNGGVHPPENKTESTQHPIEVLKLPKKLVLPLRQHVGNMPKIIIAVGEQVLKGQLLAEAEGAVSAAIHAPTSGTVSAIAEAIIPHPSGLPDICVTLIPDGLDEWIAKPVMQDWRNADKNTLVASLRLSGIVGLGGATFPTHIKLRANGKSGVHTLVINAAECEPYITCDDMLMRERADQIMQGISIAQHLLGAENCVIGIEDNKPQATDSMRAACVDIKGISVKVVPTLYPSGDARRLIYLLLGIEIPSDKRSTDVGIQVFNVATAVALYRFFTLGEPSISRIVSMTGNVQSPQNFEVLFGTPVQDLITAAGGIKSGTSHFIMGGPMMGFDLHCSDLNHCDVPITKASNCIIAATPNLFAEPPPAMPCIRCARCADVCPVSLQPQELYWFAKSDNFEKARDYQLFDCIECGACSYVCPSNIPLVQYYRYAKSEIIAAAKAKEAADLARERNEFKLMRIEREKIERTQKHAQRANTGAANINGANISKAEKNTEKRRATVETTEMLAKTNTVPPLANDETNQRSANEQVAKKQAAIATAIERVKALKAQTSNDVKTNSIGLSTAIKDENLQSGVVKTGTVKNSEITEQEKPKKQAIIAAAIERAKAQKATAIAEGDAPKNTEPSSKTIQAEIKEIDARRKEFLPKHKE